MTKEEVIRKVLDTVLWTRNASDDNKKYLTNALVKALEQEPKSEWEQDHAILKAYSDGANEVLDKVRAEIDNVLSDGMIHKKTVLGIIDKYKAESEETDDYYRGAQEEY